MYLIDNAELFEPSGKNFCAKKNLNESKFV